jgi:hypothetical protein
MLVAMTQSIVIAALVGLLGCGGEHGAPPPADAAPRPVAVEVAVADAAPAPSEIVRAEIPVGELREALARLRAPDGELRELRPVERRVEAGSEPVDGALTSRQIDRVIKSRAGVLRACYEKQLAKQPELAGKVTVAFTIAKDGAVAKAEIDREASTLHDDMVEACVLRQFGKLRFPAASTEAKVRYPLLFSAPR